MALFSLDSCTCLAPYLIITSMLHNAQVHGLGEIAQGEAYIFATLYFPIQKCGAPVILMLCAGTGATIMAIPETTMHRLTGLLLSGACRSWTRLRYSIQAPLWLLLIEVS